MGALIMLASIGPLILRRLSQWQDRRPAAVTTHQAQIARWVAGRGPDPREVMFCNGVPVDPGTSPELSSLA